MTDEIKGMDGLVTASKQISIAIGLLNQTISQVFPNAQTLSSTATGGSATLPASPVGFLNLVNPTTGATIKVPYYD